MIEEYLKNQEKEIIFYKNIDSLLCDNCFKEELYDLHFKNQSKLLISDSELIRLESKIRKCIFQKNVETTYKSAVKRKAWDESTPFAYERALPPELLEKKYLERYDTKPRFITLYRSGMSAIYAAFAVIASLWRNIDTIGLNVLAYYFETKTLVAAYVDNRHYKCKEVISPVELYDLLENDDGANLFFIEMMDVNMRQEKVQVSLMRQALLNRKNKKPLILVLDNSLVFDEFDITKILESLPNNIIIITVRSCIKLEQFGLELSNLGILELYSNNDKISYDEIKRTFSIFRSVTGLSISYSDEKILLSNLFKKDLIVEYCRGIKHNTRKLYMAIKDMVSLPIKEILYLENSPFFLLILDRTEQTEYEDFIQGIVNYIKGKSGEIVCGTSFGFRHTRIERISYSESSHSIRISPGYYWGLSCDLLIQFFNDSGKGKCKYEEFIQNP